MDVAISVPDFRRKTKGNFKHKLEDILVLMLMARAGECVSRSSIIEFGRHNLKRFHSLGTLETAYLPNLRYTASKPALTVFALRIKWHLSLTDSAVRLVRRTMRLI